MSRIKRGKSHLKRRKNLLKRVKGFGSGRKNLMKQAKVAALKAGSHSYRDRRVKKRDMRGLWQIRINALVRDLGVSYSQFMGALKKHNITLDRKILSQIAQDSPAVMGKLVEYVKK
jgi:large subunit ribosomal protein L20